MQDAGYGCAFISMRLAPRASRFAPFDHSYMHPNVLIMCITPFDKKCVSPFH